MGLAKQLNWRVSDVFTRKVWCKRSMWILPRHTFSAISVQIWVWQSTLQLSWFGCVYQKSLVQAFDVASSPPQVFSELGLAKHPSIVLVRMCLPEKSGASVRCGLSSSTRVLATMGQFMSIQACNVASLPRGVFGNHLEK